MRVAGGYNYGAAADYFGRFQLDISFPLEIISMFFFTLVVLLGTIHNRLRVGPPFNSHPQPLPYIL